MLRVNTGIDVVNLLYNFVSYIILSTELFPVMCSALHYVTQVNLCNGCLRYETQEMSFFTYNFSLHKLCNSIYELNLRIKEISCNASLLYIHLSVDCKDQTKRLPSSFTY